MVRYKHGRKLVGDRTAKSRLSEIRVTKTQFTGDAAIYCWTRDTFEQASSEFACTAAEWGLTVNVQKTKALIMGGHLTPANTLPIQVGIVAQ